MVSVKQDSVKPQHYEEVIKKCDTMLINWFKIACGYNIRGWILK